MAINNNPFGVTGGFDSKENERKGSNSIQVGKIVEARLDMKGKPKDPNTPWFTNEDINGNYRGPLYRVQMGDHKRYWLPMLHLRAKGDQEFWALEVGEQVVVFSPSGDPMNGFILGSLPQNDYRPPVGDDDKTVDKRPWRETVHRHRYADDYLWEYDRKLHRLLQKFEDGTRFSFWFKDDREQREKECDSDKTGCPPRHYECREYADGHKEEILWDEDSREHIKRTTYADGSVEEHYWKEDGEHYHETKYKDGGGMKYDLKQHTFTIMGNVSVQGTLMDSAGNTNHHSH